MKWARTTFVVSMMATVTACSSEVVTTDAPSYQQPEGNSSGEKNADSQSGKRPDGTGKVPAKHDANENLDDQIVAGGRVSDDPPQQNQTISANGSNGSGGRTGDFEGTFTASNGKSSTYKINVPGDIGSRLYGVSIHLHGDGGGDYDWLYEPNVRIAKKHDLIGIVVLAPNGEKRWYNEGEANAIFLNELIDKEILGKYNLDRNRVYFSGVSGGSQFLTGQFIPKFGAKYNSGALLLCGGPENWLGSISSSKEFISKFKMFWYSGTGDFLYDQILSGISYYKNLGIQVDSEMIQGAEHCDFPGGVSAALEAKLPRILR